MPSKGGAAEERRSASSGLADHGKGLEVTPGEVGAISDLQLGSDVVRWEWAMEEKAMNSDGGAPCRG